MDTCHNILSKTMERLTPKSEPLSKLLALGDYAASVGVGLSATASAPLWWGVLMVEEAEGGREQEVYGKSPYLPILL